MIQAAPNESRVTGTVRGRRPDPERPGFVILDLEVEHGEPIEGERDLAPATGALVPVTARESLVGGLEADAAPVVLTMRMVGPGVWMVHAIEPAGDEAPQL